MALKENDRTLVPRLRFPEFRHEKGWAQTTLGSIANNFTAGGTPDTSNKNYWGGDLRWMSSGELNLKRVYEVAGRITREGLEHSSTKLIPPRCILIGLAGQGKTRGTIAMNMLELCTNQSVAAIFPNDPVFNGDFLYHNLDSRYAELRRLSENGEGRGGLNLQIIKSLTINLPSIVEQQKIADCLNSLEELIAAQGRKVKALRAQKNGLMQQLFPRKGETAPRLRLPEFRGVLEWEEKNAGVLFVNRTEKGIEGLPIYSVTTHDGMIKRSSIDRDFSDIQDVTGNKKAWKNDIVYNMMRMWQGAVGMAIEDCLVSPAYVVLAPQSNVVSKFFTYLFKLPETLLLLTSHSRGLTKDRLRLYYDDFARIPLRCPSEDEQQRIADFLGSLDAMAAAESEKLAALKAHKKGLMQQLFPSLEED